MRIKCPNCDKTSTFPARVLEHGATAWTCPSCQRRWRVATAFISADPDHVSEETLARVRGAVKESGFTQAELAHLLGFSAAYISLLLGGKKKLTRQLALQLLHAAGILGDEARSILD